ncbi:uncharacterized protein BKA55DRAFT_582919 [Fusarium redolens]|uniref:Uncharacterized protein n=1 Tax=Fusarium redolens TaxID=48865 RepID=A0A9P9JMR0_FUSRE|nr:uncharacterized protein BKA55DRAFT_582919 [Fusarium redolens]KAH7230473.1 hypothetical protein BKA55DRAFT_582919 [Fusarium redolens]
MDIYAVIYEHDPEASLNSVDVVVVQYDAVHHTLTPVLFTHSKWVSEDIGQYEEQVVKAALTYMARGNLQRVHALTTVGLSFQVWVVNREKEELEPFKDSEKYIDADCEEADILVRFVDSIEQTNR